jgi:glucosamine--fructose-6-phosphate aminotransferase (isomerizing)
MCGIVAIVSRTTGRPTPVAADLLALLDRAVAAPTLVEAAPLVAEVDTLVHGVPGVLALAGRSELIAGITARLDQLDGRIAERERSLESEHLSPDEIESINAELLAARDAVWAVRKDRLLTAAAVADLAGRDAGESALAGYLAIQQALSAIDRMEVRGRDSAGIHVMVWNHGLDLADPVLAATLRQRAHDPLFQSGSVRVEGIDVLGFVYKAAAEIGELGDNVRALRKAVHGDALLRQALAQPGARVSVLGHTRWASVGIISEPNCHPVNSEQAELTGSELAGPYAVAVLNGDVDNHADIKVNHGLRIAGPITTDAKVIPSVMALHASKGADLAEAFRRTVAEFEGSVAIAAASAQAPDQVFLALRGSGQALYIGLGDDMFIVASEPYGVVEETTRYLRVDGETPSPSGSRGQVFVLDGGHGGQLAGVRRIA